MLCCDLQAHTRLTRTHVWQRVGWDRVIALMAAVFSTEITVHGHTLPSPFGGAPSLWRWLSRTLNQAAAVRNETLPALRAVGMLISVTVAFTGPCSRQVLAFRAVPIPEVRWVMHEPSIQAPVPEAPGVYTRHGAVGKGTA